MIEARQLTKRYGDKTAVDGVDFTVRPGLTEPWRSAIPWYQPGVAAALPAGRAG